MAEVLGTSKNNAYVMVSRLRDSVEESITAFIMARRGRRECPELDEMLTSRGAVFFDIDTRKAIARHIDSCPTCQEQRKKLVSPTAIFGALAAVPVPLGLKEKALAEAMGKWAATAGSEAGKAGGLLSRLTQPIRSPLTALRQAGWFTGWKGATLLAGLAVVGGTVGGGAGYLVSGAFDGQADDPRVSPEDPAREIARALAQVATPVQTSTATPTSVPTPSPTTAPTPVPTQEVLQDSSEQPQPATAPPPTLIAQQLGDGLYVNGVRVTDDPIDGSPAFSPDSKTLAFDRCTPTGQPPCSICMVGIDGSGLNCISANGMQPHWSPSGDYIAFKSLVKNPTGGWASPPAIYWLATGTVTALSGQADIGAGFGPSPDGQFLLASLGPFHAVVMDLSGNVLADYPEGSHIAQGWSEDGRVLFTKAHTCCEWYWASPTQPQLNPLGEPLYGYIALYQAKWPWGRTLCGQ